jgi:predicted phosphodiesterase
MRYLILTDIHGNAEALDAVLAAAADQTFEEILLLGDLVGYGAGPNEVIAAVRGLSQPTHVIRGNHDKVVAQIEDGSGFNRVALAAVEWTIGELTTEHLAYVRDLPAGPLEVAPGLSICHGSPIDEDEYLLSTDQARRTFETHSTPVTFFGHTHIPTLFSGDAESADLELLKAEGEELELAEDKLYLINPGSVGQPRDRDPRAAFMIYDADERSVKLFRIGYPLEDAQQRILDAGLPPVLAQRLAVGI